MDSLAQIAVAPIREDEFTIDEFAEHAGVSRGTGVRILRNKVKDGILKSRPALKSGKRVTAYSSN